MNNIIPLIALTLVALGEGFAVCYIVHLFLKQIERLTKTETEKIREENPLSTVESPRQTRINEWKYGRKE
jgi:hypothetical protein